MRSPGAREHHPGDQVERSPRGYVRADERIREDVCEYLAFHSDIDARDIEVIVEDGDVTLRGSVNSRRARYYAEDLAATVRGVRDVVNLLKVPRSDQERQPSTDRALAFSGGGARDASLARNEPDQDPERSR